MKVKKDYCVVTTKVEEGRKITIKRRFDTLEEAQKFYAKSLGSNFETIYVTAFGKKI